MTIDGTVQLTVTFASSHQYPSNEIGAVILDGPFSKMMAVIEHFGRSSPNPLSLLTWNFATRTWRHVEALELTPDQLTQIMWTVGLTSFSGAEHSSRLGHLINLATKPKYKLLISGLPQQPFEPGAHYCLQVTEAGQAFEGRWIKTK